MIPTDRQGLLIVVADGARARLVRCADDNALHTVREYVSAAAREKSSGLRSDGPGATMHSGSTAHHAVAPRHDPHELEKERFAAAMGEAVNAFCAAERVSGVILAAPAHALGEMREALSKPVAAMVIGTLSRDLTKVPDHELQPHLAEWVPPIYRPHSHI